MGRKKKEKTQDKVEKKLEQRGAFYYAHGRRKTATARVRLYEGDGKIIVNEKPIEEYFPGTVTEQFWQRPFEVTETLGKYSATVKVEGSGKNAQLGALVHGLARSLVLLNPDFKSPLRKAGLLTRDPRAKERRKYGLAQKARKGKQHPKR
jgi:small subunit ribosomal protein S9